MSSIVKIYTDEVYDNLKPLYAQWEPGKPVQLGDFGILRDRTFIQLGNIQQDLGLTFTKRSDNTKDHKFFASQGSVDLKFNAKGSVPVSGLLSANASLEIAFSNKKAVFFSAADCEYVMIEDKVGLGKQIMTQYEKRKWEREWVVVSDLIKAGATTIAVSGGQSASIVLEAGGDVERISLADASLGLTVKTASNIAYQVIAEKGLIPLLGLCKIQSSFLWFNEQFRPLISWFGDFRTVETLENSPLVQTEESKEALYFGQLK